MTSTGWKTVELTALAAFDVMVTFVGGREEGLEDPEPISSPKEVRQTAMIQQSSHTDY